MVATLNNEATTTICEKKNHPHSLISTFVIHTLEIQGPINNFVILSCDTSANRECLLIDVYFHCVWGFVLDPCFVVWFFVSFYLSHYHAKEERPGHLWLSVLCASASQCHGWSAVCDYGIS